MADNPLVVSLPLNTLLRDRDEQRWIKSFVSEDAGYAFSHALSLEGNFDDDLEYLDRIGTYVDVSSSRDAIEAQADEIINNIYARLLALFFKQNNAFDPVVTIDRTELPRALALTFRSEADKTMFMLKYS